VCLRGNPGQVLLTLNQLSINLGQGLVLELQQIDLLPHYAIMNSLSSYRALFSLSWGRIREYSVFALVLGTHS
jgi:hypothetical protein